MMLKIGPPQLTHKLLATFMAEVTGIVNAPTYRLYIDEYRPTTALDAHHAINDENETTSSPTRCVRP